MIVHARYLEMIGEMFIELEDISDTYLSDDDKKAVRKFLCEFHEELKRREKNQ